MSRSCRLVFLVLFAINVSGVLINISAHFSETEYYFKSFKSEIGIVSDSISVSEKLFAKLKEENNLSDIQAGDEYHLLHLATSNALLAYNRCVFHGTAFFWHEKAWIFTAPSGIGKTTQFRLWKKLYRDEVKIINGDKPILEFREDHTIIVHPSPWMGKERWGSMLKAPLGGIIYLEQGKENKIERMVPHDAVIPLYKQFLFLPEKEEHIHAVCSMEDTLLRNIPVWKLINKGDLESAQLTHDVLLKYLEEHSNV